MRQLFVKEYRLKDKQINILVSYIAVLLTCFTLLGIGLSGCGSKDNTSIKNLSITEINPIANGCKDVLDLYYITQEEAKNNYFKDIAGFDGWILDARYGVDISYSLCKDNTNLSLLVAETINSNYIEYGGVQATFKYEVNTYSIFNTIDSALMLQGNFADFLFKADGSIGGGVNYGLFLHNDKIAKSINIVIGVYTVGQAYTKEIKKILYDPTTNTVHISTIMDYNTKYCTFDSKSSLPFSTLNTETRPKEFKRVLITYENMINILKQLKKDGYAYGSNPADWYLTSAMLQVEVEEQNGYGKISGVLESFGIYKVKYKME